MERQTVPAIHTTDAGNHPRNILVKYSSPHPDCTGIRYVYRLEDTSNHTPDTGKITTLTICFNRFICKPG